MRHLPGASYRSSCSRGGPRRIALLGDARVQHRYYARIRFLSRLNARVGVLGIFLMLIVGIETMSLATDQPGDASRRRLFRLTVKSLGSRQ